jgi:hypothetical protein
MVSKRAQRIRDRILTYREKTVIGYSSALNLRNAPNPLLPRRLQQMFG